MPTTIYMVYMATLIDTNVVVMTFGPPTVDADAGDRVWHDIKNAILKSPPDQNWQSSMVDSPSRVTPEITSETKLPAPTPRVIKCLDAAKRAADRLGYTIDGSGFLNGRIVVRSTGVNRGVTIRMRFVDFGPEIVTATDLTPRAQRQTKWDRCSERS